MTVRSGQFDRQGNAVTIANQMALAATLRPICWIWPSQHPPKTARTEQLSTTARNQSIWPSRESQSSNAKWLKSQIPFCCQSRSRRQQVIPKPQASAFGSIRQGIPLRSRKIMPARQVRSVRRGRPPCGLGDGIGRRGSIKSITHQERARQPCEGPPRAIECRSCYLAKREFCYRRL